MSLDAADFAGFFRAIHGHVPFPWQQALVDQLSETDEWPDVLDLPTGSGKTAALDVAVFHLALRRDDPGKSALRIALVVDRRLVVDDAYSRASRIACALAHPVGTAGEHCESCRGPCARRVPAGGSSADVADVRCESCRESDRERCPFARSGSADPGWAVVAEVAGRLRALAGDGEPPLVSQRLRGGAPLEHDWARTPTQPVILCSTVDQVGSRLLFRGYGTSDRMKPVHAGLLGHNSLILLDEAHLSEPFRQTLDGVRTIGKADMRTVVLTATPGVSPTRPFALGAEDRDHPVLRNRLRASKPARLEVIRQGEPADAFAKAAREMAEALHRSGVLAPAIGVVVNRVDLARAIFEKLRGETTMPDPLLMIGRSREVGRGRVRIVKALHPYRTGAARVSGTTRPAEHAEGTLRLPLLENNPSGSATAPLFVVSTQCLEVGVDLDLDGLVTQVASLDALRQRFGRLNRDGRQVPAKGRVLALAEDVTKSADDPVYGDRLRKTWEKLWELAARGEVDFGITALERSLRELGIDTKELAAPRAAAPVLMPAYLDLWSQTWPLPMADPDVGLFLHGVERSSADVSLVWRGDVAEADLEEDAHTDLKSLLVLVPPRATEKIDVPIWLARAWLRRPNAAQDRMADVPERPADGDSDITTAADAKERFAFLWAGVDDPRTGRVRPAEMRPGDLLVLPAEYGGCDEFGWAPMSGKTVEDVADEAARPFRRQRYAVRIARDVAPRQWDRLSGILADDGAAGLDLVERLLEALPADAAPAQNDGDGDAFARPVRESLAALRGAKGRISVHHPYTGDPEGGAVLVATHGLRVDGAPNAAEPRGGPATEDDGLSRTAYRVVSIDSHTDHVVARVSRFVQTLDLPPSVPSDLELAAFLHDAGKADTRFQSFLAGGDPWNRPDGPAMAKSGRPLPDEAWERAGLPLRWRHEALSVRMARVHPRFAEAGDPALVLWLIGTHHGFGRPFFDFVDPSEEGQKRDGQFACLDVADWRLRSDHGPQSLAFDFYGQDWVTMYETLKERYGVWRLAQFEAILRLADHRASESERIS